MTLRKTKKPRLLSTKQQLALNHCFCFNNQQFNAVFNNRLHLIQVTPIGTDQQGKIIHATVYGYQAAKPGEFDFYVIRCRDKVYQKNTMPEALSIVSALKKQQNSRNRRKSKIVK
jgi:hypothetical protein